MLPYRRHELPKLTLRVTLRECHQWRSSRTSCGLSTPLGVLVAGFVGDRVRTELTNRAKKAVGSKVKEEVQEVLAKTKAGRGLRRRLGRALDDIGTKVRRARLALLDAASETSVGETV